MQLYGVIWVVLKIMDPFSYRLHYGTDYSGEGVPKWDPNFAIYPYLGYNVGPAYAGALALMSSFRAYSGFWIVLGTLFNVKFWGQNS